MTIPIRELSRAERPALIEHFLKLGSHDRRLRFGTPLSDHAVREYVERIDFAQDAVFAIADDELHLLGVAHLARAEGHAELGVSVLEGQRGRGIGGALLARAHLHARNWGVNALLMHCLTENAAMMRRARRCHRTHRRPARAAFPRPRRSGARARSPSSGAGASSLPGSVRGPAPARSS